MEKFWNSGQKDIISGLDILGARRYDQSLERLWVSGITTISIRARYLTLLPWVLTEFYQRELDKVIGDIAEFDEDKFKSVLQRLEFIVFVSSKAGYEWGETGDTYGVLGSNSFMEKYTELFNSGIVSLNFNKGGDSFGTYAMPCRQFGILGSSMPGNNLITPLTPRGQKISDIRVHNTKDCPLTVAIFNGGEVLKDDILEFGSHFSINGLLGDDGREEKEILQEFISTPYAEQTKDHYVRFNSTIRWVLSNLKEDKGKSSADIIQQNYSHFVYELPRDPPEVENAWFEYELKRKIHFSLELLLSSLKDTIDEYGGASLTDVLNDWSDITDIAESLQNQWASSITYNDTISNFSNNVSNELFDSSFIYNRSHQLSPSNRSLFALMIIVVAYNQVSRLRQAGEIKLHDEYHLNQTFRILKENWDSSIRDCLGEIINRVVIEPHLNTSWRKIGQGQKCSARFFPDGDLLRPTDKSVSPWFSQDRLRNVIQILSDLGFCYKNKQGKFLITENGKNFLDYLSD